MVVPIVQEKPVNTYETPASKEYGQRKGDAPVADAPDPKKKAERRHKRKKMLFYNSEALDYNLPKRHKRSNGKESMLSTLRNNR